MKDIEILAKELMRQRERAASAKAVVTKLRTEFEEEIAPSVELAKLIEADVEALEEELRAAAVEAFKVSGDKSVAPGIGIRENPELYYDEDEALEWALSHEMAVKLDKKKFEAIAVGGAGPSDLSKIVTIAKVPSATIATDLSKHYA